MEFASVVDAVPCAVALQQAMRWQNSILLSLKPILAQKAVDPGELSVVVGHDGTAECDSLSGNEQIVTADRPADLFEPGADQAIDGIGWHLEWENVEDAEHSLELHRQSRRCPFRGPVSQFRRDDDAGVDLRFANLVDVLGYPALRMANEVADNFGIEQVGHQSSAGSGVRSGIGGKSSSIG